MQTIRFDLVEKKEIFFLLLCFQLHQNSVEFQQIILRIESFQKFSERNETKINEMQKQIDKLQNENELLRSQNERLNADLTDFTDLYQVEVPSVKSDLKNLEERLLYKVNDYCNELLEKLEKLDTRVSHRNFLFSKVSRRETIVLNVLTIKHFQTSNCDSIQTLRDCSPRCRK